MFPKCNSFAYTSEVKAAPPSEYESVNEWLCSGNYDMSHDDWKTVYNTMLRFASHMERLDTVRAKSLGMLAQVMAWGFMSVALASFAN